MRAAKHPVLLGLCTACLLWGCGDDGPGHEPDAQVDATVTADASPDAALPFEPDPERVLADIESLAATDLAGRAPGTTGNETAVAMVETLFEELGLVPAGVNGTYRQGFQYDAWAPTEAPTLSLDGTALERDVEFSLFSYSGSADVTAEVVFVGYGLTVPPFDATQFPQCPLPETGYDDYAGVDVTGRVALVLRHGPDDDQDIYDYCPANAACDAEPCLWNFGYKSANAQLHGASAVLIVEDYRHPGDEIILGYLGAEYYHEDIAALFVDRGPLEAALPDLQTWAAALDANLAPQSRATGLLATVSVAAGLETVQAENVLGAVEGQDAELGSEVVVIGAHLDHLGQDPFSEAFYPGADDNASGTAVMMELARGLAASPEPPARTVLFAAWNAEEAGLLGSEFYTQNPTYPLEDTILAFSVDMVGLGDGAGVLVNGGTVYRTVITVMQGAVADTGASWTVIAAAPLDLSDHASFTAEGIPGLLVTSTGDHLTYHTPADGAWDISLASLEATLGVMWPTLGAYAFGRETSFQKMAVRLPASAMRPNALDPRLRDR